MKPVIIDASLELRPVPAVIALLVFASGALTALHVVFTPDVPSSSAAAIAAGSLVMSVVGVIGLLITRGVWTRRLGLAIAAGALAGVAWLGLDPWGLATVAVAAAAIVGCSGPWLTTWIRRAPALGPGPVVVMVMLVALAMPIAVGVTSPNGLGVADTILAVTAPIAAWVYSAGRIAGLWALRLVVPIIGGTAFVSEPTTGRAVAAAITLSVAALAWQRAAMLAVRPLLEELPGPRRATPKASPP